MALKCLNATLQCMCLQANKAILTHGVIFIAAACLQWEQIVWFWVCDPLTSTINISTEHEGSGDTIKTVLEGFDPKLAGALVVAGVLQQKKSYFIYVWKIVQKRVIVAQWGWGGRAYPHVKALLCGKQKESLISFTLFWHTRLWRKTFLILLTQQWHWFLFLKKPSLKKKRGKVFLVQWIFCQPPSFFLDSLRGPWLHPCLVSPILT